MSDEKLARIYVDLVVPPNINRTQMNQLQESIVDHAGAVTGMRVLNRTKNETHPAGGWHIHDGATERCGTCRSQAEDGRNAEYNIENF